jgi:16S rRNA processing protein RimM
LDKSEDKSELVVIGRFGAPFGVKGWIHCHSYTTPPENILGYPSWLYEDAEGQWRPIDELQVKKHHGGFVARLESASSREDIEHLRGLQIAMQANQLPELDTRSEIYWRDLVGCQVRSAARSLGVVAEVLETGANDVLRVTDGDAETLIPYVKDYVISVDLKQNLIEVDWHDDWS